MSDDGRLPVTRRSALKGLGLAGVGSAAAAGTLYSTSGTVSATSFQNRPTSILPGMTYTESDRYTNYDWREYDQDDDLVPEEIWEAQVRRSVQNTNVRIVREDDSVNPSCGDGGSVEYRFSVGGVAQAIKREWSEYRAAYEVDEPDDGPFTDVPNSDRGLLSIELDDDSCGTASLQPHNSNVVTDRMAAPEWIQPVEQVPDTESLLERDTERALELADRGTGHAAPYVGIAERLSGLVGIVNQHAFQETSEVVADKRKTLSKGFKAWNGLTLALDVLYDPDPGPYTSSEYSDVGVQLDVDGAPSVAYGSDFTVRVPIDHDEPVTVDVDHGLFLDPVDGFDPVNLVLANRLEFEITIPPNADPESIDDVRYPVIELSSGGEDPPISASTYAPDVGEDVTFVADEGHFSPFESWDGDVDNRWEANGERRSGTEVQQPFDSAGHHSVRFDSVHTVGSEPIEFEATHGLTFQAGGEHHLRPLAAFDVTPDDVGGGDEVTLDASPSYVHDGTPASYEWTVRSIERDASPSTDWTEQALTGETATFEAEYGRRYEVQLEIDVDGYTDTTTTECYTEEVPLARFTAAPEAPAAGQTVAFDATDSVADTGEIVDYEWTIVSWPQDTSEGQTIQETRGGERMDYEMYSDVGYRVTLTVEDEGGEADVTHQTFYPEVDAVADLSLDPGVDAIEAREEVTLDSSGSFAGEGDLVDYDWTIQSWPIDSDPGRSVSEHASGEQATFTAHGGLEYRVRLAVADQGGNEDEASVRFSVEETVLASFDADAALDDVAGGDEVVLDASAAEGPITDYDWTVETWQISDGPDHAETLTTGSGQLTSFEATGGWAFRASLEVEGANGSTDATSVEFQVEDVDVLIDDQYEPQDVNGDGLYRDVTGDGSVTNADVTTFFETQHRETVDSRPDLFDFNDNGDVGQGDVVTLFEYV